MLCRPPGDRLPVTRPPTLRGLEPGSSQTGQPENTELPALQSARGRLSAPGAKGGGVPGCTREG